VSPDHLFYYSPVNLINIPIYLTPLIYPPISRLVVIELISYELHGAFMKKPIICICAIAVMLALSPMKEAVSGPSKKTVKKYSVSKRASAKSTRYKSRKKSRRAVFTCDQYSRKTLNKKARRFKGTINHASKKYGVSPHFIKAVIAVESCFKPRARGGLGEKGLMQLMPGTARMLGVKNGYSPWQNIHGGTKYLKSLLVRYNGNKHYAAAAYNGGPGAVSKKYGPKFKQVRRYSRHVMRAYKTMNGGRLERYSPPVKSRKVSLNKKHKRLSKKQRRQLRLTNKRFKKAKLSKRYRYKSKSAKRVSKKRSNKKTRFSKHRYHRVKSGNTLYSLARVNRMSVAKLKRLNGLRSNKIKVGTRLRLR